MTGISASGAAASVSSGSARGEMEGGTVVEVVVVDEECERDSSCWSGLRDTA